MATASAPDPPERRRTTPPVLFFCLLALTVVALAVAAMIPSERVGVALRSPAIFRVEAAGIVWLVGYLMLAGIRLAWRDQLFKRLPLPIPGGGNAETPDNGAQAAVGELETQLAEMREFRSTTRDALEELRERIARVEGRLDG